MWQDPIVAETRALREKYAGNLAMMQTQYFKIF